MMIDHQERTLSLLCMAALVAAAGACGGSGSSSGSGGAAQSSSAGQTTSAGPGSGGGGAGGGAGGSTGCTFPCSPTLGCALDSEFCSGGAEPVDCSLVSAGDSAHVCGVPLGAKGMDLARSSAVKEHAGDGPPQLGCFAPGGYPAKPGASMPVTMSGIVRIFSHGCESKSVKIEVFPVKHTPGPENGDLGPLIGGAVTTPSDCAAAGVPINDIDCGTVYQCKYAYAGVPTETELVIKTSGALWAPMYEYNVYLADGSVKNGGVTHDVRALASDDFNVISQAALGTPPSPGKGMVLGEVHDCGDVRLKEATVDIDLPKKLVTYFTSNEAHPLPDVSAAATGALGLYAVLDATPGAARVAAAGLLQGDIVTAGFTRAHVFADAVTLVTFRGLLPSQVP